MNGMRRVTTLTIVLGLSLLVFAAPVLAQDEGEEPVQINEEEPVQISSDSEPAVTVTIPPPSDSTPRLDLPLSDSDRPGSCRAL